jgi:hypothetical protein
MPCRSLLQRLFIRPLNLPSTTLLSAVLLPLFSNTILYHTDIALDDESPYPEVAAAVANTDDPEMPVNTLRAWTLGIFWAILLPGINEFFYFRYPSILVSPVSPLYAKS